MSDAPWRLKCKTCTRRLADDELENRRCAPCEARLARRRQVAERIAELRHAPPPKRRAQLYERLDKQNLLRERIANALTEGKETPMTQEVFSTEDRLQEYAYEFAGRLQQYCRSVARTFNKSSVRLGDDAELPDDLALQELHDLFLSLDPERFEEVARLDRRSELTKTAQRRAKDTKHD